MKTAENEEAIIGGDTSVHVCVCVCVHDGGIKRQTAELGWFKEETVNFCREFLGLFDF